MTIIVITSQSHKSWESWKNCHVGPNTIAITSSDKVTTKLRCKRQLKKEKEIIIRDIMEYKIYIDDHM